jgi:hypothetical protein
MRSARSSVFTSLRVQTPCTRALGSHGDLASVVPAASGTCMTFPCGESEGLGGQRHFEHVGVFAEELETNLRRQLVRHVEASFPYR